MPPTGNPPPLRRPKSARATAEHHRIVLIGTGTEVGKTHVACALLAVWSENARAVGLKPVETGVASITERRPSSRSAGRRAVLLEGAADGPRLGAGSGRSAGRAPMELSDQERLARAPRSFHVKQRMRSRRAGPSASSSAPPLRSLYTFPEPVSPHLAARDAGTRIDLGAIERWVVEHQAPVTVVETAGGLFSPLGHGTTNFDLMQAVRPDAVILVAPDRLGVLHEVTTTLALAAARGGPDLNVVLSAPAKKDASTGRNFDELVTLGIARPLAVFPRAPAEADATLQAAACVIAFLEGRPPRE